MQYKIIIGVDARMIEASGIGKVIENILNRIIRNNIDWQFYIMGRPEELRKFPFYGLNNVVIIPCHSRIYSIAEQFELLYKMPRNIDWFWSPHYNIPLFYTGKLLVTIHDVFHLANAQFVKGIHKKVYAKIMFEAVAHKAKKVICVSNFTAREFCKYTGVDKNKIKVIYNGVDESWFNIKNNNIRPVEEPYYIYVGNIKPHKNLVRLIKAYRLIKDRMNRKLVLVGKKAGFITGIDNINALIEGLEDRIIFTGYLDDKTLQYYVTNADAMIFPSLYEGFGLPPLEAMACGCPVLASSIPSIKEMCCDDVKYFDPYDVQSIANAMLSDEFVNLQRVAKNVEQKYKWDFAVKQVTETIKNMCIL